MKRLRWPVSFCLLVAVAAACSFPEHKDLTEVSQKAVTLSIAGNVVAGFNAQVDAATASYNLRKLRSVETGSLYAIDAARLFAGEQLGTHTLATSVNGTALILAGRFRRYPLWFVAVTAQSGHKEPVAGVFVRDTSTGPWRLSLAPRLAVSAELPPVATSADGSALLVRPTQRSAGGPSPQQLVDRYTSVLADPGAPYVDDFSNDAFLRSVRASQLAQPRHRVAVTETWAAEPVRYALRLASGGALVFATVVRTDIYRVRGNSVLDWQGSPAAAYFGHPVRQRASVTYNSQLLLLQPPSGKTQVIGEYGGLVAASGH
jgi:hypothetical protein